MCRQRWHVLAGDFMICRVGQGFKLARCTRLRPWAMHTSRDRREQAEHRQPGHPSSRRPPTGLFEDGAPTESMQGADQVNGGHKYCRWLLLLWCPLEISPKTPSCHHLALSMNPNIPRQEADQCGCLTAFPLSARQTHR